VYPRGPLLKGTYWTDPSAKESPQQHGRKNQDKWPQKTRGKRASSQSSNQRKQRIKEQERMTPCMLRRARPDGGAHWKQDKK
jgi:hypothetical protein